MASINSTVYGGKLETMLTTQDVMDHLHIKDKHTFADLVKQGLPHIKIGNKYLIPQNRYLKWIEQQTKNALL